MRATPVNKKRLEELWLEVWGPRLSPDAFEETLALAEKFLGLDVEKAPDPIAPTALVASFRERGLG